ncbi:MAG: CIA30 family protein [Gammaproteobacteria bacterium]|nr:CIA30 family protein [Gammaproteobacteria bacterium]
MLIDDMQRPDGLSTLGTRWEAITDRVMGGLSEAVLAREAHDGRASLRLTGRVRLDNDGGFVQMALDLDPEGGELDASARSGVALVVQGNGERYGVHLRTADVTRPWQSYRAGFVAGPDWTEVRLPFRDFTPHRLDAPLDPTRLRRLGLVAIGRPFRADLRLARIGFYRES